MIGTGADDPQKMDPKASRETLDHSIMYIFAVALQDGRWHHVESYAPKRAARADTVAAVAQDRNAGGSGVDRAATTRPIPNELAFGGRVEILLRDGSRIEDELAVANAHPHGARPFGRDDYIRKFLTMTDGIISRARVRTGSWRRCRSCRGCRRAKLGALNVALPAGRLAGRQDPEFSDKEEQDA